MSLCAPLKLGRVSASLQLCSVNQLMACFLVSLHNAPHRAPALVLVSRWRRRAELIPHSIWRWAESEAGFCCAVRHGGGTFAFRLPFQRCSEPGSLGTPPEGLLRICICPNSQPPALPAAARATRARGRSRARSHAPRTRALIRAGGSHLLVRCARLPPRGACAAPFEPVRKAARTFCWTTGVCCDRTVAFRRRCAVARAVIRSRLTCRAPRAAPCSALRAPRCAAAASAAR